MVTHLLAVARREEPREIVIHVNTLKEGWGVTNLYTILPLRAANARILIEQSIGRGLRLPYGKRTSVTAVDRLSIVAHDRFQEIVAKTTELVVARTIDIPRILAVPKGEVTLGFNPFRLDLSAMNFQPVDRDLLIEHSLTNQQEQISASGSTATEKRLEDYPGRGLIAFDDISYDDHAELLYDLAGQVISHLRAYLDEDATRNVLQYYERQLVDLIHTPMQAHQWEGETDYEVKISEGFTELKESAFTASESGVRDFRQTVGDKSKVGQHVARWR